ncbi:MAG: hypothetical protein HY996_00385 [Micrococcales bacterium]|nr:hypothetical protein [Micrococcales bacterium]
MSGDRFVVVGDLINDIVVVPRGALRPDTDTPSTIRPRPGGSAANTAAWLGALGAPVDFVGAVGSRDSADHERMLRDQGVTPHLQIEFGVPTGTIVIIVSGEQRTMLTERGANALLAPDAVSDGLLASAAVLHLSAYSFLNGFGVDGARRVIDRARAAGVLVALNPGSVAYVEGYGADAFLASCAGADLFFPNRAEGRALTGAGSDEDAVDALLGHFPTVVLTRGTDGAIARSRGSEAVAVSAPSVRLVDPTGAGDAFAAGFLERWLPTRDLRAGLTAGAHLAARAVMAIGGRPPV